jgi:tRNA (guanine-N7-)-methyltransferase
VGKNKLKRWAEMKTFNNVFEKDETIKGKWKSDFFKNDNPLVVELGCGRGEYTVNMGKMFPEKNFVGVDIKGARLWRGAKTGHDDKMGNLGFLRCQIELINDFFAEGEVDEIWITFPDPQPQEGREKKRLTSPRFMGNYRKLLNNGGDINFKTDNLGMFEYTLEMIEIEGHKLRYHTFDLYNSDRKDDELMNIKTTYEKIFLKEGVAIKYMHFNLNDKATEAEKKGVIGK